METGGTQERRLNHVEFAHRPGEQELVIALFEALGCPCHISKTEQYGEYVVVDLDGSPHGNNDIFVSQAEPEHLALEVALADRFSDMADPLASAYDDIRRVMKQRPFRTTHIGLRIPTVSDLDTVVAQLTVLADGPLAGRLDLGDPITRTREESASSMAPMKQLWIWTDVVSAGLMTLGQQIELQAYHN